MKKVIRNIFPPSYLFATLILLLPVLSFQLQKLSQLETQPITGNIYYVATNGSDRNSGNIDEPFSTINYGIRKLGAGDTLFIRGGTYHQAVTVDVSGTELAPITISGYNGEPVLISGDNYLIPEQLNGDGLINVTGSWNIIKNLEISQSGDNGIRTHISGNHNLIDNVYAHHNWGSGAMLSGDYDTVQNSRFFFNSLCNDRSSDRNMTSGWGFGVSCARQPHYCTIRNSVSWENWGEGISTFESYNSILEDNIVFNNFSTNMYLSDTQGSILRRNLIFNIPGNITQSGSQVGILIGDEKNFPSKNNTVVNNFIIGTNKNIYAGSDGGLDHLLIANNTLVNSADEGNMVINSGNAGTARIINNIFIQKNLLPNIIDESSQKASYSHNLWSKSPGKKFLSPYDVVGNPLLTPIGKLSGSNHPQPDWFTLQTGSPAINQGMVLTEVTDDYFKNSRGASPDIGAYESGDLRTTSPAPMTGLQSGDATNDGDVNPTDYLVWLSYKANQIFQDLKKVIFGGIIKFWGY
jgi:parallel beta-helix repeat protein